MLFFKHFLHIPLRWKRMFSFWRYSKTKQSKQKKTHFGTLLVNYESWKCNFSSKCFQVVVTENLWDVLRYFSSAYFFFFFGFLFLASFNKSEIPVYLFQQKRHFGISKWKKNKNKIDKSKTKNENFLCRIFTSLKRQSFRMFFFYFSLFILLERTLQKNFFYYVSICM